MTCESSTRGLEICVTGTTRRPDNSEVAFKDLPGWRLSLTVTRYDMASLHAKQAAAAASEEKDGGGEKGVGGEEPGSHYLCLDLLLRW